LKRTKLQRLRMQSRLEQPSLAADEQVGQTRSPRLPAPKQHHQHTRAAAAAAAAAAAVIVARGRESNFWEGCIVAEQRANSHANSMFASLSPFTVFPFIEIVCEACWC